MPDKIVVVKVGSSVLVQDNGELNYTRIANLVGDMARLKAAGYQIVLVSSGAVAAGRFNRSDLKGVPRQQRDQLFAAVGQPKLIHFYSEIFSRHFCTVSQLLLTRDAFAERAQYFSIRDTLRSLLANQIVPIVNDNDILHQTTEGFSDNDQLAACLSGMLNATYSIFLTTPAGVLLDRGEILTDVRLPSDFETADAAVTAVQRGRGGMRSKINACRLLFDLGISSAIAAGGVDGVLGAVLDNSLSCTRFHPVSTKKVTGVRKWLCTGAVPQGSLTVSQRGGEKITKKRQRSSLLANGIAAVSGQFAKGDVVCVRAENQALLGFGICRLSSNELEGSMGTEGLVVIHADYFYGTGFGFFA